MDLTETPVEILNIELNSDENYQSPLGTVLLNVAKPYLLRTELISLTPNSHKH